MRKVLLHTHPFFVLFHVGLLLLTVRDGYSETEKQYSSPCLPSLARNSTVSLCHIQTFSLRVKIHFGWAMKNVGLSPSAVGAAVLRPVSAWIKSEWEHDC